MENRKITAKQIKVLENILMFINENGFSPTVRELCAMLGYSSTSTAHHYLQQLQDAGIISYEPTKSRTIRVVGHVHLNLSA